VATLIEVTISGLSLGAIYALVGLSLNIVYLSTRVISFAQGDVGMLAVAAALWLNENRGFSIGEGLAVGYAGAIVVALLIDLVCVRALRTVAGTSAYGWIVTTLGASIIIQNTTAMWFGSESSVFPSMVPTGTVHVLGGIVATEKLETFAVVVVVIFALAILVQRTQWGRAARAIALNPDIAAACGVNVSLVRASVIGLAAVLVSLAATLSTPQTFVNAYIGTPLLLSGVVAVVLGGIGRVPQGLVGGLALGLANAYAGRYAPPGLVPYIPFILLLTWLLLAPDLRRLAARKDRLRLGFGLSK
jgi:branched-chain amino acid transport system permease protein